MAQAVYELIERKCELVNERLSQSDEERAKFDAAVDLSWIYHDNALEGVVLTYHELNAAIDDEIISDVTLIPSYEDVQNHRDSIRHVRATSQKKARKPDFGLDYLKKLHHILSTETAPRPGKAPARPPAGQYRKDNPLHRMYFHEIAPPEKISYQMRKMAQWLESDEAKKMHPVMRASFAHHKLIAIFPWPRHAGKVARLLMNALLLNAGLVPAVIHAVERQKYYESLRQSPEDLTLLVVSSLNRTLDSAMKMLGLVLDEVAEGAA